MYFSQYFGFPNFLLVLESPDFKISKSFRHFCVTRAARNFSGSSINVEISGKSITRVYKVKSLGLLIDEHLTWKDHVDETVKKISKVIGALKRVRPFISVKTALQIYHALIRPYFDYCSSVWGECSGTLCDKLQKLQNRAARVITRSGYDVSAKHLLISLRQDNLT